MEDVVKYVVADYLTFLEFQKEQFLVRDAARGLEHRCCEGDFRVLQFLQTPRTPVSLKKFIRSKLHKQVRKAEELDDFGSYIQRFLRKELILIVNGDFVRNEDAEPIIAPAEIAPENENRRSAYPTVEAVGICPTDRCNLKCRHCSQNAGSWRKMKELSLEEYELLFQQLDDWGTHRVRLTGGEPLVRPDVFEIMEEAAKHRFGLYLFTNATLLDLDKAKKLSRINEKKEGNFLTHLSLDGGTPESHDWFRGTRGSFNRLVEGMGLLKEHGIPFYCEMVLHKKMIDTLEDAIKLCIWQGAGSINLHTASSAGRGRFGKELLLTVEEMRQVKQKVNELRSKYRDRLGIRLSSYTWPLWILGNDYYPISGDRYDAETIASRHSKREPGVGDEVSDEHVKTRCMGGIKQIMVGPAGDVFPCASTYGLEEYNAGNIRQAPITDLWRNGTWEGCRSRWFVDQMPICKHCKWLDSCGLGFLCRPSAYQSIGDFLGPPPSCIVSFKDLGLDKDIVMGYLETRMKVSRGDRRAFLKWLAGVVRRDGRFN